MKVNLKEIAKLWVYMVATTIGLVACGLLYVRYGETVGSLFLGALYLVGVACSYFSGTSPEVSDVLTQRMHIGGSLFWFILLAVTAFAATLCYVFYNHSVDASDITEII